MARRVPRMRKLRLLLWAGAVVFAAGALLDLAVHALLPASPFPFIQPRAAAEDLAHTVTFVGMLLLLAGVVVMPRPRLRGLPAGELPKERR